MSDNGPCNCDQAIELTAMLKRMIMHVIAHVDETHHYELRELADEAAGTIVKWEGHDGSQQEEA